jgi:hypothetical protein
MSYGSILVHLEFSGSSESRLQYATDLAGDLDAFLIGFTASAIRPVHASELGVGADAAYGDMLFRRNRERFEEIRLGFSMPPASVSIPDGAIRRTFPRGRCWTTRDAPT